jgi:hypothetical protein
MERRVLPVVLILLITACAAPESPLVMTPTLSIPDAARAIAAVKLQFVQVAQIQSKAPGSIGATTDITAFERADGWDLVFWQGSGDCPAGCIDNHYFYFSAKKDGQVMQAGEYLRKYNADKNSFDTTGAPMWGVPK